VGHQEELRALARGIVDANLYMTLASADADGRPWATPVYFAAHEYREFLWISKPDARHSQNIATRPEVGIVIFDSQVRPGTGRAVYAEARAEELTDSDEFQRCLDRYNSRFDDPAAHDLVVLAPGDVRPPALHRLYRATASALSTLDPAGHPDGRGGDHRAPVEP
jgi:nitroimidazol reductase NimA-like FMN-containing flavoprotein (pyridoxamine 5'-phosphate oxidase superfamily)